jgi:hypothetical protein
MKEVLGLSITLLFLCGTASGATDGFGAVRCGSDIPQALIGRTLSNERVGVIEARHKDLGLKDIGGEEISGRLFLTSWQICGAEYALLEEKDVVRDVLKFPHHSKESPEFTGACKVNGKDVPGIILAVLKQERGTEDLSATAAWKIDEEGRRFVKLATEGLRCPRDGVITADGGL